MNIFIYELCVSGKVNKYYRYIAQGNNFILLKKTSDIKINALRKASLISNSSDNKLFHNIFDILLSEHKWNTKDMEFIQKFMNDFIYDSEEKDDLYKFVNYVVKNSTTQMTKCEIINDIYKAIQQPFNNVNNYYDLKKISDISNILKKFPKYYETVTIKKDKSSSIFTNRNICYQK